MVSLKPISREFYRRDTPIVARELLGRHLVRRLDKTELMGRIVEVEAYRARDDPASHAHRRKTPRNAVMFGKPGVAYVYFTYGNHYCLNVVAKRDEDTAGAVLIRALQPLKGIEVMKKNRGISEVRNLTSGPGKLTKALKIDGKNNGVDMTLDGELFISKGDKRREFEIMKTTRVGVKVGTDKEWRFYIKGNDYISKR